MNAATLLAELKQQHVNVWAEGENLRIQAPKGAATPALRARIAEHKAELLAWLKNGTNGAQAAAPPSQVTLAQRYQPFPLTDIQHAYWIGRSGALPLGQVSTHGYTEFLYSHLDVARLTLALNKLIARHEMLRTVILPSGQQQILASSKPYEIFVLDLGKASGVEQEQHLAAIRQAMSHQVLSLEQAPPFDIRVTRLSDCAQVLHVSIDLLLCDVGSLYIILDEWGKLYENPDTPLAPLEFSFRDYVLAEEQAKTTAAYQAARDYWHKRIGDFAPGPELPLAQMPATLTHQRFQRRTYQLEQAAWQSLKRKAQQFGISPSVLQLTLFAATLKNWCKAPRFTLNLTLFNRPPLHLDIKRLVGDFTSLILVDVDYTTPLSLAEQSKRLQLQLWEAIEHRHFTGVEVIRELSRRQRNPQAGAMPIVFTSAIGVGEADGKGLFDLLNGEVRYAITQTPQLWLDHQIYEYQGGLLLNWDTVDALFPPGMVDAMFAGYCDLIERFAGDEGLWQEAHLTCLPSAQASQYRAVNATAAPLCDDLLPSGFLQQVQERPTAPAVITPERTLTYQALYQAANQLGHWLRAQGVKPNQLVAVVMEKGWEQVVAVLGIHLAGAAYLPIDPSLPTERQHYLLHQGEVTIALTQQQYAAQLTWPKAVQHFAVDTMKVDRPLPPLTLIQKPTDIAYVIYTSGSTGLPKGVVIDHRGAVNTLVDINQRFGVTSQDRVLALSALNFDLSVYDIFGLLTVGGAVVFPAAHLRTEPEHWLELMRRHAVTLWDTVPALMQMLVDYAEVEQTQQQRLPAALRLVMMSGDWIPVTLPDRIYALWPHVTLYSLGGATEASIWSIYYPITKVDPSWPSIPYGKPMRNQTFYVMDADLNLRPHWAPGDLYIGGIGLALGYWKDEQKTNERFIIHPRTHERLYKTGDLGRYLPDGNIEFLGRADFQVKIRGHRIELGEIESALLQHPAIKEAVVTAVGNPKGNRQLVAYVVTDTAQQPPVMPQALASSDPAALWREFERLQAQQAAETLVSNQQLEQHAAMNAFYLDALYKAFADFAIYQSPNEQYTLAQLVEKTNIAPRYTKWLKRALAVLVDEGWLCESGTAFRNLQPLPNRAMAEFTPVSEASQALFTKLRGNLAALLTEQLHWASLYADERITAFYAEVFKAANATCVNLVKSIIAQQSGMVRVLEVGGGYGTTTRHLLPLFTPQQTHYTFTDVSSFFLQQAKTAFAAYAFLDYGLLNLEVAPQGQGYEPHSFELIIASSVLHVPRRVDETLAHLRTLLAPGGLLVVIEETQFHRFYDLSMGLQAGFERFSDHELRPFHPLLSPEQWQRAFALTGFQQSIHLPQLDAEWLGVDLMVVQAPLAVHPFEPQVDPQTMRSYLAQKLPDYMIPATWIRLDKLPLSPNGKVDRKALPLPQVPTSQERPATTGPQTPTQATLVEIWSQVLQRDDIGIFDNFFDLGGDSLLATQILSRIRTTLQLPISLRALLERPTLADLATHIQLLTATSDLLLPTPPVLPPTANGEAAAEGEVVVWD